MSLIRLSTVDEVQAAPNLEQLLAEYAEDSAMPELGKPHPQFDTYRVLERSGMFHPIGAWQGPELAGFIAPIVVVLPHYGVLAATVESFFVAKAERKTGLGMRLLQTAENLARGLGAKALLVSAPTGSQLNAVMDLHKPYRPSNQVYVRALQ